jgi:hypothetical protein
MYWTFDFISAINNPLHFSATIITVIFTRVNTFPINTVGNRARTLLHPPTSGAHRCICACMKWIINALNEPRTEKWARALSRKKAAISASRLRYWQSSANCARWVYPALFYARKSIAEAAYQSLVDARVRRRLFPRMYVWSDSALSHFRGACAPAMKMAKTLISTC